MHRNTLAVLALGLVATTAQAQKQQGHARPMPSSTTSQISVGPVLGLNYTSFYGSDATGMDSHAGFTVGGQLDRDFGSNGTFRTGLLYSQRGAQSSDQGVTSTVKLSYLEVPAMFGYRFGTGSTSMRPYVNAGAQLGLKVGCSLEASGGGQSASQSCQDAGANISSTDVAGVVGAGLSMPMGTSSVDLHLGYSMGLTKIEKDTEMKNRGFTFRVGYMLPWGR